MNTKGKTECKHKWIILTERKISYKYLTDVAYDTYKNIAVCSKCLEKRYV
jgi:hypothetical protein